MKGNSSKKVNALCIFVSGRLTALHHRIAGIPCGTKFSRSHVLIITEFWRKLEFVPEMIATEILVQLCSIMVIDTLVSGMQASIAD